MPTQRRRTQTALALLAVALMARHASAASLAVGIPAPNAWVPGALPYPAQLAPQVRFWTRVYTEIDSSHGFLHDARHLDVVYRTVVLPAGLSRASERAQLRPQAQRIADILAKLGRGERQNLTPEQGAVLAAWPAETPDAVLRKAAHEVRYQAGQKEKFLAGLLRARLWKPYIQEIIDSHHLPRELAALPHVESSFDSLATSKAHAAGMWQFTPATAKRFMRMDAVIDERFDPLIATRAAAALLSENFRRTGAWPLAITAYNHGAEGMRRAVRKMGTTDLPTIIDGYNHRTFGFASRNFYTELLAAWEVSTHAEKYFGPLQTLMTPRYVTVRCDAYYTAATLAQAFDVDIPTLQAHNPALRPAVWRGRQLVPQGYALRLPEQMVVQHTPAALQARLQGIAAERRFASAQLPGGKTYLATSSASTGRHAPDEKTGISRSPGLCAPQSEQAAQASFASDDASAPISSFAPYP